MLLANRNSNWLPDVFNDFFNIDFAPRMSATAPAINVIEKDNEYSVELAAPGMTKDDFKVSLDENDNLVLDLEKKVESNGNQAADEKPQGRYLRREFSYTKFHQALILPDDVDREQIAATVTNGVLTVNLPKKAPVQEQPRTRMIEIQ